METIIICTITVVTLGLVCEKPAPVLRLFECHSDYKRHDNAKPGFSAASGALLLEVPGNKKQKQMTLNGELRRFEKTFLTIVRLV